MSFEEHNRQLNILHTRMLRMEAMMQQILAILTTSASNRTQQEQLEHLRQELSGGQNPYPPGMGSSPASYPTGAPAQEPPQMQAIRSALMAGDKLKAIKLYRELYGVDMKTAQDAINRM